MSAPSFQPLAPLLQQVSRSFYLTLRILPGAIRPQIGLAYLLARATDTIADTGIVSQEERLQSLDRLRDRILGGTREPLDFGELAQCQGTPPERVLLQRIEEALAVLAGLAEADQRRIREVLRTITSGQALDLQRFGGAGPRRLVALRTFAELDDYTYRVAGCVGEFWTRLCRAHLFPNAPLDESLLLSRGVEFGQGLQMVNILRDLPADLRMGRCYLPSEGLARVGLTPEALLQPSNESVFRPFYDELLARAQGHLEAGWAYTGMIPRRLRRLRLGCAWPLLIAVRTLNKLRTEDVLIPGRRVKISRGEVRRVVFWSVLLHPFPRAWDRLFTRPGR